MDLVSLQKGQGTSPNIPGSTMPHNKATPYWRTIAYVMENHSDWTVY
jgi:hypothetical protein